MHIEIDRIGTITEGHYKGYHLLVEADSQSPGAFYIRVGKQLEDRDSVEISTWVDCYESLNSYFRDVNWSIQW